MTAPHGTPGPDDGYVKYRCLHTPGPAPAHPYIRPAYDTRQDEAYGIIRDGLLNELMK